MKIIERIKRWLFLTDHPVFGGSTEQELLDRIQHTPAEHLKKDITLMRGPNGYYETIHLNRGDIRVFTPNEEKD